MRLVFRYPLSPAVVLAALAATAAVSMFARPQYRTPDQRTVDLAHVHHFSRTVVRRTFAAHGIQLRYSNDNVRGRGPLWLSPTPIPVPTDGLYVIFAGPTGSVSWGPGRTASTTSRSPTSTSTTAAATGARWPRSSRQSPT